MQMLKRRKKNSSGCTPNKQGYNTNLLMCKPKFQCKQKGSLCSHGMEHKFVNEDKACLRTLDELGILLVCSTEAPSLWLKTWIWQGHHLGSRMATVKWRGVEAQ